MEIPSIYVKNMLSSLSFGTAAQAECVCCSERKNHLFVRDPRFAPHQCLLCRKASTAIAWGSFMHIAENSVKGEGGGKKSLFPFVFLK